ncbi:O-antigen ligase family protein [Halovivax gelatinilyticus]|uniref:O-antigen ligase family protein n=1 Tax=Halovivax gelatinilyticus TaxID=2961597 RepID=UPI0020CA70B2|nr:O-antigen ligase family protein [Halovivax gelatinilyticus]
MVAGERDGRAVAERFVLALLVAVAFVLPFRHAIEGPVGGRSIGPVLAVVLVSVWALTKVVTRDVRRPHPFHLAFGLFLALSVASLAWTVDASLTFVRIAILGYTLVLLVVAWDVLRTRARVAFVAQAIVAGVFLVGLVGVVELLAQGGLEAREHVAFGVNANELARWVVLAAPLAAALLVSDRRFGSGPFGILNVAYLVAVPFMVLATGSRQGALAMVVLAVVGLFALVRRGRSLRPDSLHVASGFVLLAVAIVAIRSVASLDVFLDRLPFVLWRVDTLGGRTPIWEAGIDAIRDSPGLGTGAGTYAAITPEGMSADPHNTIVGVAAELGLVGLAVFLVLVAIPFVSVVRNPGPTYASIGLFLAFALFATVAMLYNDPFYWLVLLLLLAIHEAPVDGDRPVDGEPSADGVLATRGGESEPERVDPGPD